MVGSMQKWQSEMFVPGLQPGLVDGSQRTKRAARQKCIANGQNLTGSFADYAPAVDPAAPDVTKPLDQASPSSAASPLTKAMNAFACGRTISRCGMIANMFWGLGS
jgi:hypothetical protein